MLYVVERNRLQLKRSRAIYEIAAAKPIDKTYPVQGLADVSEAAEFLSVSPDAVYRCSTTDRSSSSPLSMPWGACDSFYMNWEVCNLMRHGRMPHHNCLSSRRVYSLTKPSYPADAGDSQRFMSHAMIRHSRHQLHHITSASDKKSNALGSDGSTN